MSAPELSLIVPVYNRGSLVTRALASVWSCPVEVRSRLELIVVDDGSTDHTREVLSASEDRIDCLLFNEKNLGVGPTRNRGVRAANAPWITFLDSDNYFLPGALATMLRRVADTEPDEGVLLARCRDDAGQDPFQSRARRSQSLGEYLRDFSGEALPLVRRDLMLRYPFPELPGVRRECGCYTWWSLARAGVGFRALDDVVLYYETKGPNRLSSRLYLAAAAHEMCACSEMMLAEFSRDLARVCPAELQRLLRNTVLYSVMAGRRRRALELALQVTQSRPRRTANLAVWPLVIAGPRLAKFAYRWLP